MTLGDLGEGGEEEGCCCKGLHDCDMGCTRREWLRRFDWTAENWLLATWTSTRHYLRPHALIYSISSEPCSA